MIWPGSSENHPMIARRMGIQLGKTPRGTAGAGTERGAKIKMVRRILMIGLHLNGEMREVFSEIILTGNTQEKYHPQTQYAHQPFHSGQKYVLSV